VGQAVCQGQTQKVTVSGPKSSRASVIFDLDNDGDLDIVTHDFNSEPIVLISDLAQQKKIYWLKVVLVGTKANRNGLSAIFRSWRYFKNRQHRGCLAFRPQASHPQRPD
jgi:hypothetical protein